MAELKKKGKYKWKEKDFYVERETFLSVKEAIKEMEKERVFVPYYAWGDEFGG